MRLRRSTYESTLEISKGKLKPNSTRKSVPGISGFMPTPLEVKTKRTLVLGGPGKIRRGHDGNFCQGRVGVMAVMGRFSHKIIFLIFPVKLKLLWERFSFLCFSVTALNLYFTEHTLPSPSVWLTARSPEKLFRGAEPIVLSSKYETVN